MKAHSLIAFTLLTQLAIGMATVLYAIQLFPLAAGDAAGMRPFFTLGYGLCAAVTAIALVSSLLHLGTPVNAWRSLTHVRSSWLSREVVLTLVFAGHCALLTIWHRIGPRPTALVNAAEWITALVGLALLYGHGPSIPPAHHRPLG